MYKRRRSSTKRKSPEEAGVAAVGAALKQRNYAQRKNEAIKSAIANAAVLGGIDAQAYGNGNTYLGQSALKQAQMRGIGKYTGRGGFWSDIGGQIMDTFGGGMGDLGKAGRGVGSAVDSIMGRFAGAPMGNIMGHGMYTGRGAYHKNSIIDAGGDNAPLFGGDMATITVCHREYLTDIYGPPAGDSFNVQSYGVNPALQSTFPFLSQIAANYDEYRFDQLIFSYKSTTTDIGNSTTGQCGTVIQCCNYNASAAPFTDKGVMMEYFGAVSCKVTESSQCGIECDPAQNAGPNILYTRANPVISNQDLKTYDLALYQLAVANSPAAYANLPIGELWVDYTVTLRKPKLFVTRGLEVDRDYFMVSLAPPVNSVLTAANWFGALNTTNFLRAQQNNIGCRVVPSTQYAYAAGPVQTPTTGTGVSIFLPASYNGNLRLTLYANGTNFTVSPAVALLGNLTKINDFYDSADVVAPAPDTCLRTSAVAAGWTLLSASATGIYILDFYAKQASVINVTAGVYSGGDNIISITGMTASTVLGASISIEQYQPLGGISGMSTGSSQVVWVNSGGVVIQPNSN